MGSRRLLVTSFDRNFCFELNSAVSADNFYHSDSFDAFIPRPLSLSPVPDPFHTKSSCHSWELKHNNQSDL